jgi:hypothetical protein
MPQGKRRIVVVLDCSYFAWRNARRYETDEDTRQEEQPEIVLPFTFSDSPIGSDAEMNVVLRPAGWVKS